MNTIWAIALLSYKEGLKQRVLYGVIVFALFLMFLAVILSGLFLRDISKIILDLCLAAVNVGGLLIPFFLAVNLLAKDIEKRTIFTILAKPVSRSSYIVGKYFGIVLLTGTVMAVLTVATLISIWAGKLMYGEGFFESFSLLATLASVLLSLLGLMVLNAMVVLWCSLTTSSFIATLLTLATYLIGHTIDDVVRFTKVELVESKAMVSDSLILAANCIQYLFPNLAAFDVKLKAAHGIVVPAGDAGLLAIYGMAYTFAALGLSILVFHRRDFA